MADTDAAPSKIESSATLDFVAFPSRSRLALMLIIAAGFVVLGCWLAELFGAIPSSRRHSDEFTRVVGWFCILFFGFCGFGAARKMFETGEQLRISRKGIRWSPWSDQTIPWSEVSDVTTWEFKRQRVIVLHLYDPARYPGKGVLAASAGANRLLTGGNISISLTGTDRTFKDALDAVSQLRPTSR